MTMMAPVRMTVQRPCRLGLTPGPAAAGQARRHVRAIIGAWDAPVDAYVAALLTSELVTNAVKHVPDHPGSIDLVISWNRSELRVEVHDRSRSAPVVVDAPPDAEAGRGLMLLACMATDWGYRETVTGKAVYFTLAAQADGREVGGDA
jgi:anti-sigma regulatory factor (Ser/Thr protein kinase)